MCFFLLIIGTVNQGLEAEDTFSRWMGAVYLFPSVGAFLGDSYLGRYLTCVIFQVVLTIGFVLLLASTHAFLVKRHGCGVIGQLCDPHAPFEVSIFYISIYLIALGNGASEPAFATFGADQFDEEDPEEKQSKTSFYSYFYVALNIGFVPLWHLFCSSGTRRYGHFKPSGNAVSRIAQVIVASLRKRNLQVPSHGEGLHEVYGRKGETNGLRRILHTDDFVFLDRAAIITPEDSVLISNPWHICPITQVEEVKCILRLLPVRLCTIWSSVVFTQMLSLFVEQGAAMDRTFLHFQVPPASMTVFDIVSTSIFTVFYDKLFIPLYLKLTKKEPKTLTELQRIGIGLAIAVVAMLTTGLVEQQRLKYSDGSKKEMSSLSIFWQTPQYILVGVSGAFVYVAQMEFFAS
ncbi:hypothetical protein PVL29_019898 [Vitis rotundifolia]|uniref:Uncharacterized protein n=1 Tax=Vitis rotundifolia TaxID=103349 RepID=A0AA38Z1T6_VITRO|nr:hypothetical protein PVL29_019898 [Vitis rotundifolia]